MTARLHQGRTMLQKMSSCAELDHVAETCACTLIISSKSASLDVARAGTRGGKRQYTTKDLISLRTKTDGLSIDLNHPQQCALHRREREALSWSEVVKSEEDHFLRVEYEIEKELCGRTMHLRSEHLIILSNITRSSCEEYDPDAKRPSNQFQLTRETIQIDQLFHDVIDSRAIFRHDENGNDQLPGDRPSIYRTLDWLLRGHVGPCM